MPMTLLWRTDTLHDRIDCQPTRIIVDPTVGRAYNVTEGLTAIAEGTTIQPVARVTNTALLLSSHEIR